MQATEPNIGMTEALGEHAENPPTPATSGETVTALGQTWQLGGVENRIKAQFEKAVRARAVASIQELEGEAHPDTIRKMMAAYVADRGAGAYNWGGSVIRLAMGEIPGLRLMFFLLLKRAHPGMTEELAGKIFKESAGQAVLAINFVMGNWEAPAPEGMTGATNGKQKIEEPVTMD